MLSYWNTLRMAKKNFDSDEFNPNHKLKNHWWNKGIEVAAVVTTRCNLHCNYCPMFFGKDGEWDGKYPRYEESTLEEWKEWFERFPFWISQIYLTGGEPSLLPWIGDLVNWLVDRGHHVILFSNLYKPENLFNIKKSFRFVYYPTFHQHLNQKPNFDKAFGDDYDRFKSSLKRLRANTNFRIMIKELETETKFGGSYYKNYYTDNWFYNENALFHAPPNAPKTGMMYWGCVKTYQGGKNG